MGLRPHHHLEFSAVPVAPRRSRAGLGREVNVRNMYRRASRAGRGFVAISRRASATTARFVCYVMRAEQVGSEQDQFKFRDFD